MTFLPIDETDILETGRQVLDREAAALNALSAGLDSSFTAAVSLMLNTPGRVIVSGVGKSGHIGRKIAATLASTGTPAYFVHPTEASHGDLGMISTDDCLLVLSNSGETTELSDILAYAQRYAIPLIGVAGKRESTLIRQAGVKLVLAEAKEACETGIVPTTSTTMTLALGDALSVCLMRVRGFSPEDFSRFHPGGKLGARLTPVSRLMHREGEIPLVHLETPMVEALLEMSHKRFGAVGVVNDKGHLKGIVTDGDLRRNLDGILDKVAGEIMTPDPVTLPPESLVEEALNLMEARKITSVFVLAPDAKATPLGILHIHDCLRVGGK